MGMCLPDVHTTNKVLSHRLCLTLCRHEAQSSGWESVKMIRACAASCFFLITTITLVFDTFQTALNTVFSLSVSDP